MYREVALNCFRYLDFKSFAEVDRLTIPEYELLMEAVRLKQADTDYRNHLQAWLNFSVQATDKKGKPRFKKFKQFFDYEKRLEKARPDSKKESKFSGLSKFFRKGE